MLERAKELRLQLICQADGRHRTRLRVSLVLGMVLVARATATRVVSLEILACSDSNFGDNLCVIAMSGGGAYVGDVAGACLRILVGGWILDGRMKGIIRRLTSSAGAECAIAMAALDASSHHLAVHVFGVVGVDVARSAAAVGYLSSHRIEWQSLFL